MNEMIVITTYTITVIGAVGWMLLHEADDPPAPPWGRDRPAVEQPLRRGPDIKGIKSQLDEIAALEVLANRRAVLDTVQGRIWWPQ